MAVYAIGDIQGCFDEFRRLLDKLRFDPGGDRLWLVGDLVNRGPHSLEVIRFVKHLGDSAVMVLGNHDLHLLAVAALEEPLKRRDTFQSALYAHDRDELLNWLRHRPLLHHDAEIGFTLIHAGLPPQWDLAQAKACAVEVEEVLRGPNYRHFLRHMYGDEPALWSESLTGWDRLRFTVNCLTRLRYCDAQGRLELAYSGAPGTQPYGYMPWFTVPKRRSADMKIVFGHWAALGLHLEKGIYALDSGCVWGGALTALRLDKEGERLQVPCRGAQDNYL
jgi:bis(5'-nucleosyl)-tetraphosphatase (symmetrical)